MKFPILDFNKAPFKSGILFGLFAGGGLVLCVVAIYIMLMVMEIISGDVGAAGGIFGFLVLPIAGFAGFPWSLWALKGGGPNSFLFIIAAGDLINGILLGVLIGGIAKIRQIHMIKKTAR